jgi:hypothetical protein
MSKQSNVNPNHYKQAGRDRPGEDIVHEQERAELERAEQARTSRKKEPHIPNQERSTPGTHTGEAAADTESSTGTRLTDDEGMVD